ncbi:MAG: hypothetical protein ACE5K4_10140 [Candidatus Hydrothermarchaeota archaeon]
MLYEEYEINISQRYLKKTLSSIEGTACLLGGWAVYLIVNENFAKERGKEYLGSRDLDIGFHINKEDTVEKLKKSTFAKFLNNMKDMDFRLHGFRLVKHFHTETQEELSEEDFKRTPLHLTFSMYVDPIVDFIHPRFREVFGFVPIDEPS